MMRLTICAVAFGILASPAMADEDQFMTPSRNIACEFQLDIDESIYCVRRDVKRSTNGVPMITDAVRLSNKGKATTGPYEGDVWYPDDAKTLPYGKSSTAMGITCTSRRTGLTCKRGKHGFTMNSKKISVY